jgi:hypothetical protein
MSQREQYNGRVNLRVDPDLHELLSEVARRLPDLSVPGLVRLMLENARPMLESLLSALIAAEKGDAQAAARAMAHIGTLTHAGVEEMDRKTAPYRAEMEEIASAGKQ